MNRYLSILDEKDSHLSIKGVLACALHGNRYWYNVGVNELTLHVINEGLHIDVLGRKIIDLPHDHRGLLAVILRLEIAKPRIAQHLADHLLGREVCVRIIPVTTDVGHLVR